LLLRAGDDAEARRGDSPHRVHTLPPHTLSHVSHKPPHTPTTHQALTKFIKKNAAISFELPKKKKGDKEDKEDKEDDSKDEL
jgi:hypothetical protein